MKFMVKITIYSSIENYRKEQNSFTQAKTDYLYGFFPLINNKNKSKGSLKIL